MRKVFILAVILAMAAQTTQAERTATATINNFTSLAGTYSFDVWARSTGTDVIYVGYCSLYFDYNASALSAPTLSNINANYSGGNYATMTVALVTVGGLSKIAVTIQPLGPSSTMSTAADPGERICTVNLTISNGSLLPDLSWDEVNSGITDQYFGAVTTTYIGSDFTTPLPIQLASYSAAVVRDRDVEVAWKTVSETNNYGFEVYRKRNENGEWKKLGFVEGHGTTLAPQAYSYMDRSVSFGKYFYQIKQIDLDGKAQTFPEMNVVVGVAPDKFMLAQNYPNPFNPSTTIEFALPKETHVKLEVYNVIGQRVVTLVDETKPAGYYEVTFSTNGRSASGRDATELAGGLYFYRLSTNEVSFIKKMLLVK